MFLFIIECWGGNVKNLFFSVILKKSRIVLAFRNL